MKLKEPENINYAAQVVRVTSLNPLDNSNNLVGAPLLGMQAVVAKGTEIGAVGILFVAETQLSEEFTARNNLFRHSEFNEDKSKSGFIEDNRRVRAIKLRGNRVLHGGYSNAVALDDDSPCDEGVCIRVDGLAPYIAKLKSPEFYAHETKMIDDEVVDIEELGKVE